MQGHGDRVIAATAENHRRVLAAVAACPDRGPVLPVSRQSRGCAGAELSGCRAGRGDPAGAVCLAECVRCRCEFLWPTPRG